MEEKKHLRRYTELEKQELIEQWKESGKSKLIFCKEIGIGYYSLLEWIRGGKRKSSQKTKPSFVPVELKQAGQAVFVQLILKNGTTVNIHQRVEAVFLVTLLKA
jgi:hypothetical protein